MQDYKLESISAAKIKRLNLYSDLYKIRSIPKLRRHNEAAKSARLIGVHYEKSKRNGNDWIRELSYSKLHRMPTFDQTTLTREVSNRSINPISLARVRNNLVLSRKIIRNTPSQRFFTGKPVDCRAALAVENYRKENLKDTLKQRKNYLMRFDEIKAHRKTLHW